MRRLSSTRRLAALAVIALITAACAPGDAAEPIEGMPRQTHTVDRVEIAVTPLQLDAAGAVFEITFDTHTTALDVDVATAASMRVGEVDWGAGTWDGDAPGGHHREGVLRFAGQPETTGTVTLALTGFSQPVRFDWPPPVGRG